MQKRCRTDPSLAISDVSERFDCYAHTPRCTYLQRGVLSLQRQCAALSARRRCLSAAARDGAAAMASIRNFLRSGLGLPLRCAGSSSARAQRHLLSSFCCRVAESTGPPPGAAAAAARANPSAAAARLEPPPSPRPFLTSRARASTRSLAGFSTSGGGAADVEPPPAATHDPCVAAAGGACGVAGEVVEIHFPTRAWCGLRAL